LKFGLTFEGVAGTLLKIGLTFEGVAGTLLKIGLRGWQVPC